MHFWTIFDIHKTFLEELHKIIRLQKENVLQFCPNHQIDQNQEVFLKP
jgi:hypothetical protein